MRYLCLLLAVLLLAGCAGAGAVPEQVPVAAEETAPETEETVPETEETTPETEEAVQAAAPAHPLQFFLDKLSTEQKVGQLFLARCPEEHAVEDISQYNLSGYILFGRDFEGQTPDSIRETLESYQAAPGLPLLIAVDEEGGTVCRVSCWAAFRDTRFASPRSLYDSAGMEAVISAEAEKAELLTDLGINVNMAPVCDIAISPGAFMYNRSLGQGPDITAEFVRRTVETMKESRMGSVLKHFPGYGENDDTHTGFARDSRTLEELEQWDLIPFRAGIDAGCGAVLVEHTIVDAFDPELPASLSPEVHRYLREEMGFRGVIVTDDLQMQAITDAYGPEEAAVLAVLAGNDLLCSTDYRIQYEAVLEAVHSGRIPMETLDAAALRVLTWKQNLGLLF